MSSVKLGSLLWEPSHFVEMSEELSSSDEVHDEIYFLLTLEDVHHLDKKWMLGLHENLFFKFGTLKLIVLNQNVFSNTLHCVNFVIRLLLHKEYLSKTPLTNYFLHQKIV